jgi:putative ABC transport system permease protein
MSESMVTALLAAVTGVALCELTLPLVNAAGGLALRIDYLGKESVIPFLLATVIAVGVGAGIYPALVLSRYQPTAVLAATRTPGGGRAAARVREILVVFQFAIAIAFTIATGVIVNQTNYLRHTDLGFKRDGLIVVSAFDNSEVTGAQRASLLDAWRALPDVVGATSATIAPGNEETTNQGGLKRPGTAGDGVQVNDVRIGPDFFQTYRVRLVAGRFLDRGHGSDDPPPSPSNDASATPLAMRNIVLDSGAVRLLGFRDAHEAIGKPLLEGLRGDPLTVVGVIDTVRFRSPHGPPPPTYYLFSTRDFANQVAAVRYAGADPRVVVARMEDAWRRIVPAVPFQAKPAEDNLQRYYRRDDQSSRLFTIGATLAVAIGCVGLYGLAAFTTSRRVHEIGIRKTLGASTSDILRLLIAQFLRPVLLANLVAWPLAWLTMRSWLAGFDQRITLSPAYFVGATVLTLTIAVATVAGQAFAVARAEPAKALHHE